MIDKKLLTLFNRRDPRALDLLQQICGKALNTLAYDILRNKEDAEECVNDTYMDVWNSVPPAQPDNLRIYATRLLRNNAMDRIDRMKAQKRDVSYFSQLLNELDDRVAFRETAESEVMYGDLCNSIERHLRALPEEDCNIFLMRYWYAKSVREIAFIMGLKENTVSVKLHRTKNTLRTALEKEGYTV